MAIHYEGRHDFPSCLVLYRYAYSLPVFLYDAYDQGHNEVRQHAGQEQVWRHHVRT